MKLNLKKDINGKDKKIDESIRDTRRDREHFNGCIALRAKEKERWE